MKRASSRSLKATTYELVENVFREVDPTEAINPRTSLGATRTHAGESPSAALCRLYAARTRSGRAPLNRDGKCGA